MGEELVELFTSNRQFGAAIQALPESKNLDVDVLIGLLRDNIENFKTGNLDLDQDVHTEFALAENRKIKNNVGSKVKFIASELEATGGFTLAQDAFLTMYMLHPKINGLWRKILLLQIVILLNI